MSEAANDDDVHADSPEEPLGVGLPDVVGRGARTHVPRARVLQLPDQVLQVPDPDWSRLRASRSAVMRANRTF